MHFPKMAATITPVPHPEPCHPPIRRWSLCPLPLNLNGPLWLLDQNNEARVMQYDFWDQVAIGHPAFSLVLVGHSLFKLDHDAARKAKQTAEKNQGPWLSSQSRANTILPTIWMTHLKADLAAPGWATPDSATQSRYELSSPSSTQLAYWWAR